MTSNPLYGIVKMAAVLTEPSILPQKTKSHSHRRRKNSKFIKQGYHKSERDDIRRVAARTFLSGITLDSHLKKQLTGLQSDEVKSGAGSVSISPVATRHSLCLLSERSNAQVVADVFVTGLLHNIPFDNSPYKASALEDSLPYIGHSTSIIESPTEKKQFASSKWGALNFVATSDGGGVQHCGKSMNIHPSHLPNKRLAFTTVKSSPFAICSVLEYSKHEEKFRLEHPRERMRVRANSLSLQLELDDMELGTSTTEVSLAHLLAPQWVSHDPVIETTPILTRKQSFRRESVKRLPSLTPHTQAHFPPSEHHTSAVLTSSSYPWSSFKDNHSAAQVITQYHPHCLDNYEYFVGRHTTTLAPRGYRVSIIQYARQSDIKKGINVQFSEVFPHVKITLTKLRSIKRDMHKIALECDVSLVAVAYSYVYYEKLVLMGKINKANRKLSAGACLLLAAKFISDIRRADIKLLLDEIADVFRISTKELLLYEFPVLVVLQFCLFTPNHQVQSHWDKLKELDIN